MKSTIKNISKLLLIALMVTGISSFTFGQQKAKNDTVKIKTSAVCGSCKARIEKNLATLKGVISASLNVDDKVCTVVYHSDKITPDAIRKEISRTGYDADDVKADPKAYNKLPPCCQKGGM